METVAFMEAMIALGWCTYLLYAVSELEDRIAELENILSAKQDNVDEESEEANEGDE